MIKSVIKKALAISGYEITRKQTIANAESERARLRERGKSGSAQKLHVGCGPRVLKGWINIDLTYEPFDSYLRYYTDEFYPPEIRGGKEDFFALDMTVSGLPLSDESVDVVFHEDFIEHLSQRDQVVFLAETWRVLKKGAVHRVNTPDFSASMTRHSDFKKGIVGVCVDEWDKWHHKNLLSRKLLEEMAYLVGYSKVNFNKRDNSESKLIPREYRPTSDSPYAEWDNMYADLIK